MNNKTLEIYKKTLCLTNFQREVLVGTLLGDAGIPKKSNNSFGFFNPSVKFEQKLASKDYINHLYLIFKDWVDSPPKIRDIDVGKDTFRQSIWFKTYSHPSFVFYYNQFYGSFGGKKSISFFLMKNITSVSIAYWYMDGGSFNKRDNTFVLHTQSFSYADLIMLSDILSKKYSLRLNLHKDGKNWKLYIKKESSVTFFNLINPYILPCFYYKIGL